MEDRKSVGKGEEHWQFQDGVGNIKIEAPGEGRAPLQINPNISLSKDDIIWAMLVAMLVVIIVAALCCMAKCNFSLISKRRKRKMRIAQRKKSVKQAAAQSSVTLKDEKVAVSQAAETKKKEKKVMAISKSNPQHHETKQKTKKDLIIDIIDSALDGDICDTEFLNYSSSESIDRFEDDQMLRRASANSLTLSLVFDTKTNLPIFRRL